MEVDGKNFETIWQVKVDRDYGLDGPHRHFIFFMKEKISNELLEEKIRFLKPEFKFDPSAEAVISWHEFMLSEIGKGFPMYEENRR